MPNIKAVVWEDEEENNWKVKIPSARLGSFKLNGKALKNEGETYKSSFINKPILEKEIIILKSNLGIDDMIKREFKKRKNENYNYKHTLVN